MFRVSSSGKRNFPGICWRSVQIGRINIARFLLPSARVRIQPCCEKLFATKYSIIETLESWRINASCRHAFSGRELQNSTVKFPNTVHAYKSSKYTSPFELGSCLMLHDELFIVFSVY